MNIEKELQLKKEFAYTKKQDIVNEVKLLLDGNSQEDLKIMRKIAPNSIAITNENKLGINIELESFEKQYGKVFHVNEIKQLAVEYKLRFLSSAYFRGNFSVEALAKLKQFSKETNTSIDSHTLETKFYILAPPKEFILETFYKVVDRDPVLFYKIDENHYRLIHKWGKDFSIFRRFLGFMWQNPHHKRFVYQALCSPIVVIILSLIGVHDLIFLLLLTFIVSFLISMIMNVGTTIGESSSHDLNYFTPDNWDKPTKLIYK